MAGLTVARRGIAEQQTLASYPAVRVTPPTGVAATDTANLIAAITAAGTAGTVVARPGTYLLNAQVTIPDGVNLAGTGNSAGTSNAGTILQCTAAGAGLKVIGSGGRSCDFVVDGNNVATAPFIRGDNTAGSGRTFQNVSVRGSAQDNVLIQYSQNDTWISPSFRGAARDNLVLDAGCGGLTFFNAEINVHGRYGIHSQATTLLGPYTVPTDITFWHGRTEQGSSASGCALQVDDGAQFSFNRHGLNHGIALTGAVANIKSTGGRNSTDIAFRDVFVSCAGASTLGLHVDNGSEASWEGGSFSTAGGAFDLAAGGVLEVVRVPYSGLSFSAATPVSAIVAIIPPGAIPTTAWTALTLQNSWVNVGSGFANVGYRKDGQGFVHLEGLIGSGTQTAGTLLATLPVLYRPDAFKLYTCPVNNTGGTATIQIGTDGTIKWQGSTGTVSWVDLGACAPFLAGN